MMDIGVALLVGFLAGLTVGAGALAFYLVTVVKKKISEFYNQHKDIIDQAMQGPPGALPPGRPTAKDIAARESVNQRLMKAGEITAQQNEIAIALQQPSANAVHSKHKNALGRQYKQLEEEKMTLLHSIVRDGFDPDIMVFNAQTKQQEQVKLSYFLGTQGKPKPSDHPAPNTDPNEQPSAPRRVERNGRVFFIHDGGKKTTH